VQYSHQKQTNSNNESMVAERGTGWTLKTKGKGKWKNATSKMTSKRSMMPEHKEGQTEEKSLIKKYQKGGLKNGVSTDRRGTWNRVQWRGWVAFETRCGCLQKIKAAMCGG